MNEMPTLKSGLIAELTNGEIVIFLPNKTNVSPYYKTGEDCEHDSNEDILNLYQKKDGRHYMGFFSRDFLMSNKISSTYDLIWSRKSDNDIKIEELQKTIDNMTQEFSESTTKIQLQIKELKSARN